MAHESPMPRARWVRVGEVNFVHAVNGLGGEVELAECFRGPIHHLWPQVFHEPAVGID